MFGVYLLHVFVGDLFAHTKPAISFVRNCIFVISKPQNRYFACGNIKEKEKMPIKKMDFSRPAYIFHPTRVEIFIVNRVHMGP